MLATFSKNRDIIIYMKNWKQMWSSQDNNDKAGAISLGQLPSVPTRLPVKHG